MSNLKKQIQRFFKKGNHVRVHREIEGEALDVQHGYFVAVSDDFVILQYLADFEPKRFEVFPVSQIIELTSDARDAFLDEILVMEGRKKDIGLRNSMHPTDWESICRTLCDLRLFVIVENEEPEDKSFDIGRILRVEHDCIFLETFDALGYYDEEPSRIFYSQISLLSFGDEYAEIMGKYARRHSPQSNKE